MKLLAVDTSTGSCSVALFDNRRLLAEIVRDDGKTHSKHLMSMIEQVLGSCALKPGDIEGVGVTTGPGTFTGLRIGISTVKGFCSATKAQVVGVNSLSALAVPFLNETSPVVSIIDARRQEVYWAAFRMGAGKAEMVTVPCVADPGSIAGMLPRNALLVGSGALLYRSVFEGECPSMRLADADCHVIRGSSVGLLALDRLEHHESDRVDTLVPNYIRKSDAQIHSSGTC